MSFMTLILCEVYLEAQMLSAFYAQMRHKRIWNQFTSGVKKKTQNDNSKTRLKFCFPLIKKKPEVNGNVGGNIKGTF